MCPEMRLAGRDVPRKIYTIRIWRSLEHRKCHHAAAIKELLKANANVLVICRGGNNRSRTLAGIAERLLDLETGETVAEGRTLPADSELCKLVEVFDDRNAATRAGKITRYKAVGVTAEGRSKRKR